MQEYSGQLVPLRDDVAEKCSAFRMKWLDFFDHHRGALLHTLRKQLKSRPDIWAMEIWPDKETKEIAHKLAVEIKSSLGLPNNYFIPEDPVEIIASFYDDGIIELCDVICTSFNCHLEYQQLTGIKTFADLVNYTKENKGTISEAELRKRRKKSRIIVALFSGVILVLAYGIYEEIQIIISVCNSDTVKPLRIAKPVFKIIWEAILIFVSLRFIWTITAQGRNKKENM